MRALLLRHGGRTPPEKHFHEGNTDVVAALLDAKPEMFDADIVAQGFTLAVAFGHADLVRLMLARGLRVPATLTGCQTYLWRNLELARLLLEHGMDANLPNWQRVTPLHHMASHGEIDAARLFLEFGADPHAIDEEYPHHAPRLGGAQRPDGFRALRACRRFRRRAAKRPGMVRSLWRGRGGAEHEEVARLLVLQPG